MANKKKEGPPELTMKIKQPIMREDWQDDNVERTVYRTFAEDCKLIADFLQTFKAA